LTRDFFSCMNQCCKFNVLWWKSKKKQVLFQVGHDCRTFAVVVHEANAHDNVGADGVIDKMKGCFPRLKKMLWRTADTKDGNWPIPYAKSSVRSLPLFSVRTSLRRNSPCCHSDVLWSALSPGWKTFEELPLITSSIPIRGDGSARLLPTHV